jgi:hypothetical protein
MIWKERNRRMFENKTLSAIQVANITIDEALLQLEPFST